MKRNNNFLPVIIIGVFVLLTIVLAAMFVFPGENENEITDNNAAPVVENNVDKTENDDNTQNETPVPENENPPVDVEVNRVSFAAVGDNIVHDMVRNDAKNKAADSGKDFDFLHMYENVSPIIKSADFAFVNQEAPVAGKGMGYSGYPNFNAPETAVYDLMETGFNVFNLANNHMLDKGVDGFRNTVSFFNSLEGITSIGGYTDTQDRIILVEKDGIVIAFLSYTYGTNGYALGNGSGLAVPYATNNIIDRETKEAREKADFVVVSIHWGTENSFDVSSTQKEQMKIMVNNGVDVIIGAHPHVLQPVEWQQRPDGKKTLVMYSLGNFLSNMEKMKNHVGALVTFDFVKNSETNETGVENVSIIPTICHFETDGGINRDYKVMRLSEYTSSLLEKHARQNTGTDQKRDMDYLYNIARDNIPAEFLTEAFYANY